MELDKATVSDMNDGGMEGIRFIGPVDATYGSSLCEADGKDADGVPLSISINLDKQDNLFELDIWKVDFSPLKRYPTPDMLRSICTDASAQRRASYQPRAKP